MSEGESTDTPTRADYTDYTYCTGDNQTSRYHRPIFPFTALVGQPRLKAALLANAVDPSIGGVLIRGEKGTGKTTIVRALVELLPPLEAVKGCPYHCNPDDADTPHEECREKIAWAAGGSGDSNKTSEFSGPGESRDLSTTSRSSGPDEGRGGPNGTATSGEAYESSKTGGPGGGRTDELGGGRTDGLGEFSGPGGSGEGPATASRGFNKAGEGPEAGAEELERVEISAPLIELPLNATEERVAGTIHLEETLRTGSRHFEPGLLAAANRGILYIDEVNLLEDHLVDLILDAAATGVHRVEREGFSLEHPADFLLIGTMNPEEGELRPQFIDRFGLCISVKGEQDSSLRKEIARRRIDFERGPRSFAAQWRDEQSRLAETVTAARELLGSVELPEALWDAIVAYAADAGVQGHRADIVMAKTASALAALNRRGEVMPEDVQEAARLALPHRLSGSIDETPETSSDRLDKLIAGYNLPDREAAPKGLQGTPSFEKPSAFEGRTERTVDPLEELQVPGSAAAGSIVFDFLKKKSPP